MSLNTKDIQNEFPGIEGFSRANIFRMRAFYLAFSNSLTAVRQLKIIPKKSFGILLCKTRNKVKAEYDFRHINRPIAAVEYEIMLTKAVPENLKSSLPTIKEIEEELEKDIQEK